jgi:hypothetical protein
MIALLACPGGDSRSHFTVVEIEATDASCLIEALEALGYTGKIEVHDRPAT